MSFSPFGNAGTCRDKLMYDHLTHDPVFLVFPVFNEFIPTWLMVLLSSIFGRTINEICWSKDHVVIDNPICVIYNPSLCELLRPCVTEKRWRAAPGKESEVPLAPWGGSSHHLRQDDVADGGAGFQQNPVFRQANGSQPGHIYLSWHSLTIDTNIHQLCLIQVSSSVVFGDGDKPSWLSG